MKTVLCTLLMVLMLVAPASARDWSSVASKVVKSAVELTHGNYSCTAFSINQKKGYFLTAYHCIDPVEADNDVPPTLGIYAANVVKGDKDMDLAVFQADVHVKALRAASQDVVNGTEVLTAGYGFGFPLAMFKAGIVALTNVLWDGVGSTFYDFPAIPGMSGGPIVNSHGEVLGVVTETLGAHYMALASASTDRASVVKFVGDLWEGANPAPASEPGEPKSTDMTLSASSPWQRQSAR